MNYLKIAALLSAGISFSVSAQQGGFANQLNVEHVEINDRNVTATATQQVRKRVDDQAVVANQAAAAGAVQGGKNNTMEFDKAAVSAVQGGDNNSAKFKDSELKRNNIDNTAEQNSEGKVGNDAVIANQAGGISVMQGGEGNAVQVEGVEMVQQQLQIEATQTIRQSVTGGSLSNCASGACF